MYVVTPALVTLPRLRWVDRKGVGSRLCLKWLGIKRQYSVYIQPKYIYMICRSRHRVTAG